MTTRAQINKLAAAPKLAQIKKLAVERDLSPVVVDALTYNVRIKHDIARDANRERHAKAVAVMNVAALREYREARAILALTL